MPQSGARMMFSAFTYGSARSMRCTTVSAVSTSGSARSMQPTITRLPSSAASAEQSSFDCAVSIDTCRQLHYASSGRKE